MSSTTMTQAEIVEAVTLQNAERPAWLVKIGVIYFCHFLKDRPNPRKVYRLRFSNLIRGGWCDIVLDTKKIGGTQDAVESVDP